jgi:hypothetical protein
LSARFYVMALVHLIIYKKSIYSNSLFYKKMDIN